MDTKVRFRINSRTETARIRSMAGPAGYFRRVDARRVNADDNQWFAKTIIAIGPHFAVWVNGYHVTDWTDQRKPHANPRKGLRLEPGTIMFQGHDPTTDVLMREIKVREISPRGKNQVFGFRSPIYRKLDLQPKRHLRKNWPFRFQMELAN